MFKLNVLLKVKLILATTILQGICFLTLPKFK